jgi:hypothetical protein
MPKGAVPYSFLLDDYPGASVAYSLRKLRSAYSGNAIRVRRTDLTEQDIAFNSSGQLDTTALLAFVGTGATDNGFVTTWYDQSTNANNSTQSTATAQPKIVDAGSLIQVDSKPSVKFVNLLFMQTTLSINTVAHSKFIVGKYNAASALISLTQTGVSSNYEYAQINSNTCTFTSRASVNINIVSGIYTTNAVLLSTITKTVTNRDLSVNGAITNSTTSNTSFLGNRLFLNRLRDVSTPSYGDGFFSEVIIYPSNKSTDKSGIETNINSFYTIY